MKRKKKAKSGQQPLANGEKLITQKMLARLLELSQLRTELRDHILQLHAAGAKVEPGILKFDVLVDVLKRPKNRDLIRLLGPDTFDWLQSQIPARRGTKVSVKPLVPVRQWRM